MKALFGIFLFFNCFAILFIAINHFSINRSRILQEEHSTIFTPSTQFTFDDPIAAYQVLEQLDLYEAPKNTTKTEALAIFKSYYKYHLSLTKDEDYCKKHRAHFVNNPESVFGQQVKVFSDFSGSTLLKTLVLPKVAYDIQPKIGPHLPKEMRNIELNDIREDTSVFFCNALYWAREIGKEFSCTTQMSNHFPGDSLLYRKDYAAETLVEYKQNYSSQPGCFDNNKFFPKTWVLYKEDQCLDFFEEFNGPIYQELKKERKIVYIRKIGANSHSAMGVEPVNDVEEESIRTLYQNGSLCGKVTKNYIVQYFVHNPLLVHGHKFDFRAYMLVASTNPVISYYHDGFMRVSLQKYDQNADDRSVFLTNTALAKKAFHAAAENGTHNGMDTAALKEFHIWNMDDLQNYLYETGVVTDPNWIENYLRPEFRKAMAHLIRMGSAPFLKSSSVYELFGLDFMLDANLNLWFIEANIFPNFEPSTVKERILFDSLLTDHFEIIFGLLRSKTKRIINYVNGLLRDGEAVSGPDGVEIQNLDEKIAHFKEITRNYYEPEYVPSPNNSYTIITDYNYEGVKRFSGLIEEQCV